jgi:hypothetical protein
VTLEAADGFAFAFALGATPERGFAVADEPKDDTGANRVGYVSADRVRKTSHFAVYASRVSTRCSCSG